MAYNKLHKRSGWTKRHSTESIMSSTINQHILNTSRKGSNNTCKTTIKIIRINEHLWIITLNVNNFSIPIKRLHNLIFKLNSVICYLHKAHILKGTNSPRIHNNCKHICTKCWRLPLCKIYINSYKWLNRPWYFIKE